MTKSQFDARKAAGTLQTGIEYMITDSDDTPYDDSLKGIIDGSITELVIPEGTTVIRNYAFYGCSRLKSATIPDSVTSIGNSAFLGCSSLTNVTIPYSVTSIGNSAFSGCSSLTNVTIPDSVTSIGQSAFYNCSSLTNVTIPDIVTSIGDYAFKYCSSLTSITIPDSVTRIGRQSLYCGSSTKKATFIFNSTTPPTIQSDSFNASYINKIIVPAGCSDAYKAATNWSSFASYIEEATV